MLVFKARMRDPGAAMDGRLLRKVKHVGPSRIRTHNYIGVNVNDIVRNFHQRAIHNNPAG